MRLWNRRRAEREMREELEALAAIAGPKQLGNLTLAMEDVRADWGWTWLDSVLSDIRYCLRGLRRQPGFYAVAVLSLALAIGANNAMFSFADALLLRPLDVPDPAAVMDVTYTGTGNPFEGMSYPDYRDVQSKSRSFAGLVAYRLTTVAAAPDAAAPARVRTAMLVTANFFPAMEVLPSEGRGFAPGESEAPGQPVAVISHEFWQEQYGGERSAIGKELRLNGVPVTIVGIAPKGFPGLDRFSHPSVYVPLGLARPLSADATDPLEDRGRRDLVVKGRLAAGASQHSAQAELATLAAALEREYPKTNVNRHPEVRTELERRIQQTPQLLSLAKMLMGLTGLILIIACSNLGNLLLARGRARGREIAIRLSIGAGRRRLVRQLMTESLVVALLGGTMGLLFGFGGILLLQTLSVPGEPPSVLEVRMDWRVVEFSLLAALGSCLCFGLVPAWQTARANFVGGLKSAGGGSSGRSRTLGRDVLVVSQIALAMVILIAAGKFLAGFRHMLVALPDFRTDHMISMDTGPALVHYSPGQTKDFYRQLVDRVRGMPGVERVAMSDALPLTAGQRLVGVVPEGYQLPKGREQASAFGASVDAAYFDTLQVKLLQGRAFTDDDRTGSRRVAIVNQQFAKTYWAGQGALGKRIRLGRADGPEAEVVGVAQTGHYLGVNEVPTPFVYLPYAQNPRPRMTLIVQTLGDAGGMAAGLREAVRAIDPNLPVFNLRPVATLYQSRVTGTWLELLEMTGTMGGIGLVLAMTGLYGLVAYTVSRRTKEFGIRIALGASRRDVVWLVERRGLLLALVGIAVGAALSVAAGPLLTAGFPGLGVSSPAAYFLVPVALVTVGAIASYVPARRAAAMDPLQALRND